MRLQAGDAVSILQFKTVKLRKVKRLAQGHLTRKQWRRFGLRSTDISTGFLEGRSGTLVLSAGSRTQQAWVQILPLPLIDYHFLAKSFAPSKMGMMIISPSQCYVEY